LKWVWKWGQAVLTHSFTCSSNNRMSVSGIFLDHSVQRVLRLCVSFLAHPIMHLSTSLGCKLQEWRESCLFSAIPILSARQQSWFCTVVISACRMVGVRLKGRKW
jgi:hypothetical protein